MATADTTTLASVPGTYFDAWNARDEHALDAFFAVAFRWSDPSLPDAIDNLEGVRMFLAGSWAGMSDLRFELVGGAMVDEAGGRVAQEWRMLATFDGEFMGMDPTGNKVDLYGTDTFDVDADGRVTQLTAYYNAGAMLAQLGLT